MEESYIRDYMENLLENNYNDDLERLKGLCYGLEYILNGMECNLENYIETYNYNRLTTCLLLIKEIIKESGK